MFWKKQKPWYLNAIAVLIALRIIYGFARFFEKVTNKQAAPGKPRKRGAKR